MPEFVAPEGYICLGRVTRPHGLRGELCVLPCTERKENILAFRRIFLGAENSRELREYAVQGARLTNNGAVVRLNGCTNRDEAELLRGQFFWARIEDLPGTDNGARYLHELMGKMACTEENGELGRIVAVMDTPAHPLLVVRQGKEEFLIPAISAFIRQVDADKVLFAVPAGLLDAGAET